MGTPSRRGGLHDLPYATRLIALAPPESEDALSLSEVSRQCGSPEHALRETGKSGTSVGICRFKQQGILPFMSELSWQHTRKQPSLREELVEVKKGTKRGSQ